MTKLINIQGTHIHHSHIKRFIRPNNARILHKLQRNLTRQDVSITVLQNFTNRKN